MSYHINGNEPDIAEKVCQGLYLIQHQESESITDQANTIFLKFGDCWFQLHFDGETIFWRESEKPSEPVNSSLSTYLSLLNLCELEGIVDYVLKAIEYGSNDESVWVKLNFSSGRTLVFTHHGYNDYTTINC